MGRMTEHNLEQYKATKASHFEQIKTLEALPTVEDWSDERRRAEAKVFSDAIDKAKAQS